MAVEKAPWETEEGEGSFETPPWREKPSKTEEFISDVKKIPGVKTSANIPGVKPLAKGALKTAGVVGSLFDYLMAAPARAAASKYIDVKEKEGNIPFGGTAPIQALFAAGKQYFRNPFVPSDAPSGAEIAEQINVPTRSLSELIPGMYSETGEGLALKKGSYTDPSLRDIVGTGIDFVDPSMAFGGVGKGAKALGSLTKEGLSGARDLGALAVKEALGEKRLARTKAGFEPLGERFEAVKDVVTGGGSFTPAQSYEKQLNVAKRNGIDPDLLNAKIKFGKESTLAKQEANLAEGVGPKAQDLVDRNTLLHKQIQSALNKNVDAISGAGPQSKEAAADLLRDKFTENVKNAMSNVESNYDTALEKFGQPEYFKSLLKTKPILVREKTLKINKEAQKPLLKVLSDLEAKYRGVIKRTPSESGKYNGLITKINEFRKNADHYDDLLPTMRELGSKAFESDNLFDYNDMQAIYRGMRKTLLNAVPSEATRKSIEESNRMLEDIFIQKNRLKDVLGDSRISPMEAMDKIIKRGSTTQIEALKKLYSPEDMAKVKSSVLRDIMAPIFRDLTEESGKEISSGYKAALADMYRNRERYKVLFNPGELKNITELLMLGDKAGAPYLSLSRTGSSGAAEANKLKEVIETIAAPIASTVSAVPEGFKRRNLTRAEQELQESFFGAPAESPTMLQDLLKSSYNKTKKGAKYLSGEKTVPLQQLLRQISISQQEEE